MIPISSKPYPYFLPGSPPQFSGCWHRPLWGARNCPDCVTYICQSLALKLSRSAQTSSPKSNFCLDLDKDLLVDFWGSWRPSKTLLPFALFSCMMIPLKSRTLRVFKIYTKLLFCMTYNSLMMWYFSYCNNKITQDYLKFLSLYSVEGPKICGPEKVHFYIFCNFWLQYYSIILGY